MNRARSTLIRRYITFLIHAVKADDEDTIKYLVRRAKHDLTPNEMERFRDQLEGWLRLYKAAA